MFAYINYVKLKKKNKKKKTTKHIKVYRPVSTLCYRFLTRSTFYPFLPRFVC